MNTLTKEQIEEVLTYGLAVINYEERAELLIAICDLALRALELHPAQGMVSVPMEPTEAMLEAAGPMTGYDSDRETADADHIAWWKAMLAAAEAKP